MASATQPSIVTATIGTNLAEVANAVAALPTPTTVHNFRLTTIVGGVKQARTFKTSTDSITVRAALKEMGVTVNKIDRVTPHADSLLRDGETIQVIRFATRIEKKFTYVPFETLYKPTDVIAAGTSQTIQKGNCGVIEIADRLYILDGKVANRQHLPPRVVKEAKNTVIALGAREHYLPSAVPYHNRYAQAYQLSARGGSPRERMMRQSPVMAAAAAPAFSKTFRAIGTIELTATGYSPDPRENGGYTRTCTGLPIGYGAAAVDPRVIPLGTKLYVEGYGYAFACDTGGAIRGHRIDLAYNSYYEANTKGRRKVTAYILGK